MHVRSDTQVLHSGRKLQVMGSHTSFRNCPEFRGKDDFLDSEFLIIFFLDAGDWMILRKKTVGGSFPGEPIPGVLHFQASSEQILIWGAGCVQPPSWIWGAARPLLCASPPHTDTGQSPAH